MAILFQADRLMFVMTRLSGDGFVNEQVRLLLCVLVCNMGNFFQSAGVAVLKELFQLHLQGNRDRRMPAVA